MSPLTFLGRTQHPTDYEQLQNELHYVDHHLEFGHADRRWPYTLALHAVGRWIAAGNHLGDTVYDVIHTPNKFHLIMDDWTERDTIVLDPFNSQGALLKFCGAGMPLVNVLTAHSVLEHAPHPESFLYQCSCLLAPGGLLILTFAYWNQCGADTALGHEHRKRIYCPKLYRELRDTAASYHLGSFGGIDPSWNGPSVGDYSYASLVLEKRR